MPFTIRYFRDEEVGDDLDRQLRDLLLVCFPHEEHFLKTRRYFHECPQNRWMAFDENGTLAAHVATHEKMIGTTAGDMRIIGIADVGVAPQFRGQGLVRKLLEQAHEKGEQDGFAYALLGGDPKIYSSSGYRLASNPVTMINPDTGESSTKVHDYVMYRPLGDTPWPEGVIDYRGPSF